MGSVTGQDGMNPELLIWAKHPLVSVGGLLAPRPSTPLAITDDLSSLLNY